MTLTEFIDLPTVKEIESFDEGEDSKDREFNLYVQQVTALISKKTGFPILDREEKFPVTVRNDGSLVLESTYLRARKNSQDEYEFPPTLTHRATEFAPPTEISLSNFRIEREFVVIDSPSTPFPTEGSLSLSVTRGLDPVLDGELVNILRIPAYAFISEKFNTVDQMDLDRAITKMLRSVLPGAVANS